MNINSKRLKACKNKHTLNEWGDSGTEYENRNTKHCTECGWSGRGEFYDTMFGDLCWVCYEDFIHAENGLSDKYLADQYLSVAYGDTAILDKHKSNLKQIVDKLTKAWKKYRKDYAQRVAFYQYEIKEIEDDFKTVVAEYQAANGQIKESNKNLRGTKMKLHEEFKLYETMWESAPRVVSKETSKLCSVVFDDHQIFIGSHKECEDWLKKANGPMADRLSIKNTAKVVVQESTPKVVRKQSDDIWTLAYKNDPNHPIVQGDKAKIDAFYNNQKDTPAAKAHGGLVIKQGGEYTLEESLTESRSVADIEAEITKLQQELVQAKIAEKKAGYGGNFPKTVWTWDIYLEPTKKGTWTGIENDLVFETKDKALDAAWELLNELDDEGELDGDPDDYYVEAFEIPLSSISASILKFNKLAHLI